MRTLVSLVTLLTCLVTARLAQAHIQLSSPTARYVQDDNGLKTAPCGSGTATGTITPLIPGQTLTVSWKESVSHAGHYRIALSANASDFVEPTSLTIPTTLPAWDLVDGIQDKTGTQTYTHAVQIPTTPCPACVLQLIQVMSTGTDGTNTGPFSGVYHACADVSIASASGDAGAGRDTATIADARIEVSLPDSGDGAPSRDAPPVMGDATGMGGNGNGGAGGGGNGAGTGGTIGSVGSGGSPGTGSGGSGSGGRSGGWSGGSASQDSGGSAWTGGEGGSSVLNSGGNGGGSGGTSGVGQGGATTSGAGGRLGGSGGSANGGGRVGLGGSGGAQGSGGNSEPNPSASSSGCSCQLGSPPAPRAWMLLLLLTLCLRLAQSEARRRRSNHPKQSSEAIIHARASPSARCR